MGRLHPFCVEINGMNRAESCGPSPLASGMQMASKQYANPIAILSASWLHPGCILFGLEVVGVWWFQSLGVGSFKVPRSKFALKLVEALWVARCSLILAHLVPGVFFQRINPDPSAQPRVADGRFA